MEGPDAKQGISTSFYAQGPDDLYHNQARGQGMTVHWVILGGSSELKLGKGLMPGLILRLR